MHYNRTEVINLIKWNKFEMSDFYFVCPFDFNDPKNKTRLREVVLWRNVGVLWAWLSGDGIVSAGKLFHRDHSTVIHAIKQVILAYEGFGHAEIIQHIESIKEQSKENILLNNDSCVGYAICQVRLENNIAKLLKKEK
jgi:hypothetical protein